MENFSMKSKLSLHSALSFCLDLLIEIPNLTKCDMKPNFFKATKGDIKSSEDFFEFLHLK